MFSDGTFLIMTTAGALWKGIVAMGGGPEPGAWKGASPHAKVCWVQGRPLPREGYSGH